MLQNFAQGQLPFYLYVLRQFIFAIQGADIIYFHLLSYLFLFCFCILLGMTILQINLTEVVFSNFGSGRPVLGY